MCIHDEIFLLVVFAILVGTHWFESTEKFGELLYFTCLKVFNRFPPPVFFFNLMFIPCFINNFICRDHYRCNRNVTPIEAQVPPACSLLQACFIFSSLMSFQCIYHGNSCLSSLKTAAEVSLLNINLSRTVFLIEFCCNWLCSSI